VSIAFNALDHTADISTGVASDLIVIQAHLEPKHSGLVIEASGIAEFVAELGEQLAWLGAALRPSPSASAVAYCLADIETYPMEYNVSSGFEGVTCKIKYRFEEIQASPDEPGQCWHPMFANTVIVKGFPIRKRNGSSQKTGLEIPLDMMAALADTRYVQTFDSKLFIKGFSTMLVPTTRCNDEEIVLWHLLYNKSPTERISYLDCACEHAEVTMAELETSRHVVGWCSEAVSRVGMCNSAPG